MTMGMGRRPSPSSPSPSSSEKPAGLYPRTRYPEHLPDDCRDRPSGRNRTRCDGVGMDSPGGTTTNKYRCSSGRSLYARARRIRAGAGSV